LYVEPSLAVRRFLHGAETSNSVQKKKPKPETTQNQTPMQPKEIVDIGNYLYEWSKCLSAAHQRDQLYRLGRFDDCSRSWQDLKDATWAKLSRDEAYARTIIANTHYVKSTTESPTIGVIWDIKEKPGWS
jgi:hypothetical protein